MAQNGMEHLTGERMKDARGSEVDESTSVISMMKVIEWSRSLRR